MNESTMSAMEELLIPEVMTNVLGFLLLSARVELATCSTNLQHRVYQDCSQAWTEMNFAFENYRMLKRLSDFQLSRLLIRVSARENTKDLDISGCALIRGSGLTPLRNSRVLEQINLYDTGADENPTPFLSTLRTICRMP